MLPAAVGKPAPASSRLPLMVNIHCCSSRPTGHKRESERLKPIRIHRAQHRKKAPDRRTRVNVRGIDEDVVRWTRHVIHVKLDVRRIGVVIAIVHLERKEIRTDVICLRV